MNEPVASVAPRPRELGTGRYQLKATLAHGGMGTIYLAQDRLAQREIAYKRLTIQKESERALRTSLFQREYDTLSQLPHPNIVEVYDYGEEGGAPYYVMELLGGKDLTGLAPLPYREACRVLRDIASALALVHARRLVHRDVSPNNVRLTADGKAKLLDFGALSPFGRAKELVGTPAFMAPECLSRAALDQRTDLYSLGALAYWALTRRTSVVARSFDELLEALEEAPSAPSSWVVGIPRELDELVLSMLAHDPRARPASAAYVIDRLSSIADLGAETDERRVAQSYLAHPPLCGRASVVAALREAVEGVREGRGRNVLVEGEAGLGRSALLANAALHAQLCGAVVLRAEGDGTSLPFRLARTLVDAALALYPDLESCARGSSSSIFSYRQDVRPGAPDAVELAERHAVMIESARATLLEVATRTPLVLVVDDVDACDPESAALLASLALDVDRHYLTIVGSGLAGAAGGDASPYATLAAQSLRFAITALSRDEIGDLVQTLFGTVPNALRLAHWLYEQAGGNPATTIDLTRMLLQRGLIRYTLGTFTLPREVDVDIKSADLATVVLARLGDLKPEVEQVARLLCLHTGPLTPEQLTAAAALPLREVLLALEDLMRRSVVAKDELGYVFVGSSLRAALEQTLSIERRQALHLALAHALTTHRSDAASPVFDPAMHFLEAGCEDEALALVAGIAHQTLYGLEAVRWTKLLEAALAISRRKGCSKEQCLSLMLPLAASGFFGSFHTQARHIETALSWTSEVCGMTLARRLRPAIGGKLSLVAGILYAAVRRALTPKRDRLGTLGYMMAYFVGLACDAIAIAAILGDSTACRRYLGWLDPLASLPRSSAGAAMREFCTATADLAEGRLEHASKRYEALVETLRRPVKGLEHSQRSLYMGTLNGRAISEAGEGRHLALELAEEFGTDAFFAAHAEVVRLSYHAIRGERDQAEAHRARAELLALRGGTSWTASVTLTVLGAYAACFTEDAIALVQKIAELQQLEHAAPKLRANKLICEAWLEHIRGRSETALALFDRVIDSDDANGLQAAVFNRGLHATVLNTLGLHVRAEEVCTRIATGDSRRGEASLGMRLVLRERAVALAGLGRHTEAVALVMQQLEAARPLDNPLELGAGHRDRARIALIAHDRAAFDEHFAAMESHFKSTKNPCLLAQCDALIAKAIRAGVRLPARPTRPSSLALDQLDEHTVVEPNTTQKAQ